MIWTLEEVFTYHTKLRCCGSVNFIMDFISHYEICLYKLTSWINGESQQEFTSIDKDDVIEFLLDETKLFEDSLIEFSETNQN